MTPGHLLVDRAADGVAVVTLNRPDTLNAITMELQRELDSALTQLEDEEAVRCLVLTGAGDRAFSSGYDLREMAAWSADDLLLAMIERETWIWHVATSPLPTIAALNGVTFGAGAIIASAVDIRFGCAATRLRFTAAAYGGANATWSLPSVVGRARAAELLLSAREVDAAEAEAIGLLNRVVPTDRLLDSAVELAHQIASNPPAGTRAVKRLLREHAGRSLSDRYAAENLAMRTELRPRPISELYAGGAPSSRRQLGS